MANQRADEEIGASGALATELGTQDMGTIVDTSVVGNTTANPLATADPSSTGIPIISTDNDVSELPPVEESTPNTPVTSPSILRQSVEAACHSRCAPDLRQFEGMIAIPQPSKPLLRVVLAVLLGID